MIVTIYSREDWSEDERESYREVIVRSLAGTVWKIVENTNGNLSVVPFVSNVSRS